MTKTSSRWWTAVRAGTEAGVCATLAMSVAMYGLQRAGLLGRMPPRIIVRRSLAKLGIRPSSARSERALSAAAHLGFGAAQGAVYGLSQEAAKEVEAHERELPPSVAGVPFGLLVWAASYAGWLPASRLFPPPSRDRPDRPTSMAFAHVVYGHVLGEAFRWRLRRLRA